MRSAVASMESSVNQLAEAVRSGSVHIANAELDVARAAVRRDDALGRLGQARSDAQAHEARRQVDELEGTLLRARGVREKLLAVLYDGAPEHAKAVMVLADARAKLTSFGG